MTEEEFSQLIQPNHEHRNLEVKGPASWEDREFKCKICKTILGMSNIRDGGSIIIGIREGEDDTFVLEGTSQEQANTWSSDTILSFVNEYADPYVNLDIEQVNFQGHLFIVLRVWEFESLPVICRRDGANGLRKGAIYTRPHRMPETAIVPEQTEMREILDMAVEKQLVELQTRLYRAGIQIAPRIDEREESQRRFETQAEELQ